MTEHCHRYQCDTMQFIYFVNNRGPRLDPWGTPTWVRDRAGPFCEEFGCSPRACVGFLQQSKHANILLNCYSVKFG